jgi:hypothetical protein
MNKANRRLFVIIGIAVVIAFVALNLLREANAESTTVTSSTSHFNRNATHVCSCQRRW